MGKLISGINGPIVGKVGTVSGSSWNGIPYIKGPYKARTKKISAKEKGNRIRFKVAQDWLSPILDFVREGYREYTPTVKGFIAAKSYLMKNAMKGEGADSEVIPEQMLVSYGDLPLSKNISAQLLQGDVLQFTWDTDIPKGAHEKDQVMMLAYNPLSKEVVDDYTGQFRKAGSDTLFLNTVEKGPFLIYMAFVAHDRSRQSNSVYLGTISIK